MGGVALRLALAPQGPSRALALPLPVDLVITLGTPYVPSDDIVNEC